MKKIHIPIVFVIIYLTGCYSKNSFDNYIGHTISFSLQDYENYNNYQIDSLEYKNKIICCLQMDCPSCVEMIYEWNQIYPKFDQKKVQLIVILRGELSEYTYYHLVENNKFDFPILWDPENLFMIKNNILFLEFQKSLLIDAHNKILLVGSPLWESHMLKKYKSIIKHI